MGNLWADTLSPLDWLLPFRNDVVCGEAVVGHYTERLKDVTKAVHELRKHRVPVGFPMETATGEMIFAVGNDFMLTAEQLLKLLDRGELHPDGVRRLVGAQADKKRQSATPMRRNAASS